MTASIATATAANLVDTDMLQVKNALRSNGISLRGTKATPEQIDKAAHDFEAEFATEMLSNMTNTDDPKDSLGGSDSEDVYKSMLNTEYGKIIARTGGLGVADQVKRMMISQQEVER
jgi:flagellar protein FlgJ